MASHTQWIAGDLGTHSRKTLYSVEGLELVGLHWCFVLVQVCKWVLCTVVVRIIVGINCLSLETSYGIKLLDGCGTQTRQGTEHSTLDLCHLCILHCIYQCVLGLRSVVLEFLGCVLFTKRCDLVEVHLQVVSHLLCQLVLRCPLCNFESEVGC